jgi:ribonuclease Z
MEDIQITFLGTGSAIPTVSRNHNGIYLKYKDRNFLVDCGEGTQRQIRKAKLNICKITDILITHFHGDHVLGLPGLLHSMSKGGYEKELMIYCPKGAGKIIKKFLDITGVHDIKYKINEVRGRFIDNRYFSVSSLALEHDVVCNGYMFEEKDRLRIDKKKLAKLKIEGKEVGKLTMGKNINVNGKLVKFKDVTFLEKGRKVSFVFDTKPNSNVGKLVKNSDLAIVEGVFLGSTDQGKEMAKRYKHLTIEDAANAGKKGKVKELIISHISQRYEFKEKFLLKEAKKIFKRVRIAKDLMQVNL